MQPGEPPSRDGPPPPAGTPSDLAGGIETGGLGSTEIEERLARFGPNAITEVPERPWLMLARKFWGVIPWMLEAALVIELVLGGWSTAGVIAAMLAFSAGLGFYQGRRGKQAVALLRSQLTVTARVRRDGAW